MQSLPEKQDVYITKEKRPAYELAAHYGIPWGRQRLAQLNRKRRYQEQKSSQGKKSQGVITRTNGVRS